MSLQESAMPSVKTIIVLLALLPAVAALSQANPGAARPELLYRPHGNFSNNVARPLRYWPLDGDFVITNGSEFFNRPLYCLNSTFRIDGGDKPEFSLYLPGRGGNLRIGVESGAVAKWLNDAQQIVTRYRAGSLIYEIHDPVLGSSELVLTVVPLGATKGVIVRAELTVVPDAAVGVAPKLIFAFGGANGLRGARGGDIGCEKKTVSEFFQLQPDQCRDTVVSTTNNAFTLRHNNTVIQGVASAGARTFVADASGWDSPASLLKPAPAKITLPLVAGEMELLPAQPVYLVLQQADAEVAEEPAVYRDVSNSSNEATKPARPKAVHAYQAADLPKVFADAEDHRRAVAGRVSVETPDPFVNAAVPALCIAADAVWDEQQQSFMHGAVAWRTRLLGWRGQYAGDALGWHERTAAHFAGFAKQQNVQPVPATIPPPDEQFNLARSEAAIHSNGDLSKNHYDMNLVGVDSFFQHLLWTGDTNYAREMWPVIERHLAWERRSFRREFGPDKLPLYEAYAAIWASDDLNYNGGGTAHASAYNYFANTMAARVATMLGKDPASYQTEAGLILRGMNKYLWLAEEGNFAECKDLLGLQLVHPNSGLWTFYITMDSQVPTPLQTWQMTRWIDTHISHIPITGDNVPNENLFTLPETSWLPYQWSLNNVVMAEAGHTSLGFWQANRPEAAFALFKGELLDSMFLGLCPGNLGCMTSHDMARGEAQRDFADAIGINSRALIEGLFGAQPDALASELKIIPGFPAKWEYATVHHPDFDFEFKRTGVVGSFQETFMVVPKFPKPMALDLQIGALATEPEITVNGKPAECEWMTNLYGISRIAIKSAPADKFNVVVTWKGEIPHARVPADLKPIEEQPGQTYDWNTKVSAADTFEAINLALYFNDKATQIFRNDYRSPRSPYASLATPKHGIGGWCEPNANFDIDDAGLRAVATKNGGKVIMPNGISFATPSDSGAKNIIFTSQWDNYPHALTVPLTGKSSHAFLLMAGSTGPLQSQFDNGEVVVTYMDDSTKKLVLRNPSNWWPIDQDYFTDDFAFRRVGPVPPRVDLATGQIRMLSPVQFKGQGGKVPGGAATVLELPLDKSKELKSLTVRAIANEIVIGLMAVTLQR